MEITWLGHSCFRIKGSDVTIVTDPFDDSVGYAPGLVRAEVVTVSHEGPHHSHLQRVQGARKVLRGPGEYEISGAFILGVKTYRDIQKGKELGANTVFRMTVDNVTVCHLGDIGHVPSADQVSAIGDIDVLLIPVGGGKALNAARATEVVSLLEPKVIVPMHYRTPACSLPLAPVDAFLKEMGIAEAPAVPRFTSTASGIPSSPQVVLLDYKGASPP